jgi:hypothetical protein
MYYRVRGYRQGKHVEYEGDIDAELFPGVDLDNGPTIKTNYGLPHCQALPHCGIGGEFGFHAQLYCEL